MNLNMDYWTDIFPAIDAAEEKLAEAGDRMDRLPKAVRVLLLVHGAQSALDNGGYANFFGSDWPDKPPYTDFVSAYTAIGCRKQAADMRRVIKTFPFPDAHLQKKKREAYIKKNYDKRAFAVRGWGDALCGDEEVWEKLAAYFEKHVRDFH